MDQELATHISLLAAAILGPMLESYLASGRVVSEAGLAHLRATAITQAKALWQDTLAGDA